jgi:predicted CXXCH cytochrome family protein
MKINRSLRLMVILMTTGTATGLGSLVLSPAQASDESCIGCHLHSELTEDFTAPSHDVKTLAGFHGQVFRRQGLKKGGPDTGCQACHESRQAIGKLPTAKVCLGCHTRGKSSQGDPDAVFHAEEEHWPMDKVSCITCHQGHVAGNRVIKFLTSDAINACQQCHKKSFGPVTGQEKTDLLKPTSDNRYGQN